MAEDRPKKLAYIGATGYEYSSPEARIGCFPWDRLGKASKRSFRNPPSKSLFKANRLPRHAEPCLRYDAVCGEVLAPRHGR